MSVSSTVQFSKSNQVKHVTTINGVASVQSCNIVLDANNVLTITTMMNMTTDGIFTLDKSVLDGPDVLG